MILKTDAICIKNTRYGESGLICKFFTLDRGIASFLVQGLNRKTSLIKNSHLMPGNILEIVYYKKPAATVNRIKEAKLIGSFHNSEVDFIKNAVLQFVLEIVAKTNEEEASDESIFYFLKQSIEALKNSENSLKYFPVMFLCKYLKFTGWYPNFDAENGDLNFYLNEGKFISTSVHLHGSNILDSSSSQELLKAFEIAENFDFNENFTLKNHKEILRNLITYYEIHLLKGRKIKSPEILSEIIA